MNICIFMPTTFVIDPECDLAKKNMLENTDNRVKQYKNGIDKLLELNKKYNFDIYIADNGFDFQNIIEIENNINIITNNPNNYGKINKGSGIIEIWNNNIKILKKYDYIIHFEPRQLLINNYFIDNFMQNPRTLFTYGSNNKLSRHFNTGLFICKSNELLNFIKIVSPEKLTNSRVSIEYILYNYYVNNNIPYNILDKMNLIWYDTSSKKSYIK